MRVLRLPAAAGEDLESDTISFPQPVIFFVVQLSKFVSRAVRPLDHRLVDRTTKKGSRGILLGPKPDAEKGWKCLLIYCRLKSAPRHEETLTSIHALHRATQFVQCSRLNWRIPGLDLNAEARLIESELTGAS